MKKIMLALSFLSVGGVVSAAAWQEEPLFAKVEVNVTHPDGSNEKISLQNNSPAIRILRFLIMRSPSLQTMDHNSIELVVDGIKYSKKFDNLGKKVPLTPGSNLRLNLTSEQQALYDRAWKEEVLQKQQSEQMRQRAQAVQQRSAASLTVAALIAAATAYVTRRAYQNRKKRLAKNYNLGNLNPLEDKLWLATIIARYGISWRLRALISNNPAAVAKLSDPFLNALAELYYGKKPSQVQMSQFMQRFFPGRE